MQYAATSMQSTHNIMTYLPMTYSLVLYWKAQILKPASSKIHQKKTQVPMTTASKF